MINSKFVKYPSIENWYNMDKYLDKYHPEFDKNKKYFWRISEKLHGSNICASFDAGRDVLLFSRNGNQLPQGYEDVIKKALPEFKERALYKLGPCFIYGEIIGPGIQKGVDYGKERKFYIFDTAETFSDGLMFHLASFERNVAPFEEIIMSYSQVKKYVIDKLDRDPLTKINPVPGNVVEGYVVTLAEFKQPENIKRFQFKIKHPGFDEKVRKQKTLKKPDDYTIVDQYINENRVFSALSKYPEHTKRQIPDVMREITNDVRDDLEKDGHEWEKHYSRRVSDFSKKIVVGRAK